MDKPISMPAKDYLIKVLSIRLNTSSSIIESVINHQFSSISESLRTQETVEISGFGKFIYSRKKAFKRLEKERSKAVLFQSRIDQGVDVQSNTNKLNQTLKEIAYLENRLKTNEQTV